MVAKGHYHSRSIDPVNMPDPIRTRSGSAGKQRAGWFLHIGLLPDRIRLACFRTGSVWLASGPDPFGLLPDRIRLACFRTGSVWLASGPNPFGQTLTQSARTKLDLGWFCTILFGRCVEERNRVWKWESGCVLPETGPADSCTPTCFQTRCVWPNPDRARPPRSDTGGFCITWSTPSSDKRNWNGCGKSEPAYTIRPNSGCTLAIMTTTGRNQNASGSDPACLLGNLVF